MLDLIKLREAIDQRFNEGIALEVGGFIDPLLHRHMKALFAREVWGCTARLGVSVGSLAHIRRCLVVEDDYLVAVDLADLLCRNGVGNVDVHVLREVAETVHFEPEWDFATLEFMPDREVGAAFTRKIKRANIPLVYVTGADRSLFDGLEDAPWVAKPFLEGELLAAILYAYPA
ncbi:MAG: hypothetical protein IR164_13355 [Devosia sp.]|uniref:hypothetical protein n=1 Tax=Devosia sp. TaxID=1871048 RepID=UPI001A0F7612|nr:hypothetical protein [Devosia sp.]MBF0679913.1 hypothetical protein [Devosia sp.]